MFGVLLKLLQANQKSMVMVLSKGIFNGKIPYISLTCFSRWNSLVQVMKIHCQKKTFSTRKNYFLFLRKSCVTCMLSQNVSKEANIFLKKYNTLIEPKITVLSWQKQCQLPISTVFYTLVYLSYSKPHLPKMSSVFSFFFFRLLIEAF